MRFDLTLFRSMAMPLGVALACWFIAPSPLAAQEGAPFAAPNPQLKRQTNDVVKDLQEKNFEKLDAAKFDTFFNAYFLLQFANPACADPKADARNTLAYHRNQLRTRYFGAGRSGPPYNRVQELTFTMMKAIIVAKYPEDPAAEANVRALKFNAMRIIGDLNQEEAPPSGGKPKPSPDAMQYLLRVFNSPKARDYLRVAALQGIARQVDCFDAHPPAPEVLDQVVKDMIGLLNQSDPGPNRDVAAQTWLRRSAAEILGTLALPGLKGGDEAVIALATALRDKNNSISLRCAAAAAFADMKFNSNAKVNTAAIAKEIGVLGAEILKKEAAWSEEKDVEPNRRRLKQALSSVFAGLAGKDSRHGVLAVVPDASRQPVREVALKMRDILKLLDKPEGLKAKDLATNIEALQTALGPLGVRVAAPSPAPRAAPRGASSSLKAGVTNMRQNPLAENN